MTGYEHRSAEALADKLTDAGLSYDEAIEWVAEVVTYEALRLVCRCGEMIVDTSEGCKWHEARAEKARELRKTVGSVEF